MFSHAVLKRFVKDHALPIQVLQEPYFDYYMDLYDEQYHTKSKFVMLQTAIEQAGSEDAFLNRYHEIRDNIITTIEATETYQEYNNSKLDQYNVPNKGYPSRDVFKIPNVGKCFMSIDLVKANFQALKYHNSDIVLGCETYSELIGKFTDMEYMTSSKYLRQVIFGNMNPKRQVKIERFMIEQILNMMLIENAFSESDICMISTDEIVVEVSDGEAASEQIDALTQAIFNKLGFVVDIEVYQLGQIGCQKFFVKQFINKSGYELMCVPIVYHAQAFKYLCGRELDENDLVFFYENQVCRFLKPIDFFKEELAEE